MKEDKTPFELSQEAIDDYEDFLLHLSLVLEGIGDFFQLQDESRSKSLGYLRAVRKLKQANEDEALVRFFSVLFESYSLVCLADTADEIATDLFPDEEEIQEISSQLQALFSQ